MIALKGLLEVGIIYIIHVHYLRPAARILTNLKTNCRDKIVLN